MPNPRPLSIVKVKDAELSNPHVTNFDISSRDRFLYFGEIAQDTTKCIIEGLYCGKRLVWLSPDYFEEVVAGDY
jgi:hypothetical protein